MACTVTTKNAGALTQRPRARYNTFCCARSTLHAKTPGLTVARFRRNALVVRADSRNSDSSFFAGFMVGGVVFGALGFLFAPQISRALLGDDQRLRLPRFLEEEQQKDPEQTRLELIEKINKLNQSMDEVSAQLQSRDGATLPEPEPVKAS